MGWNGSGTFYRQFSWIADKAAGLDISSSRMDQDTNDISANGFGNCVTRDGQGSASANQPMNTFRHTNIGNGVARTDYASLAQAQDGLLYWTIENGSATAYVATYTPALTALSDGQLCTFRAANANTTTAPTFSPNGLTARGITKAGGSALAVGDIQALQEVQLRYNLANTRWELQNPSLNSVAQGAATTGDVKSTFKTSADPGWLMLDDTTMGSASSGASSASANNQALFTTLFNSTSDTACPLLTSTGSATTRAGQGTAAAAWSANCRMTLPKALGRSLAAAGAGSGLTSRPLASITGAETVVLGTANLPAYTPSGSIANGAISISHNAITGSTTTGGGGFPAGANSGATISASQGASTFSGNAQGGSSTPFGIMQPSFFTNFMIKQ